MHQKKINIFVSHRWKYPDDHTHIISLLDKYKVRKRDFSVSKNKSLGENLERITLEEKLDVRIRNCSIFIVSSCIDLGDAVWVKNEVSLALKHKKYILAIRPKGRETLLDHKFISRAVVGNGKIINYNSRKILETIQSVSGVNINELSKKNVKNKKRKTKRKIKKIFRLGSILLCAIALALLIVIIFNKTTNNDDDIEGVSKQLGDFPIFTDHVDYSTYSFLVLQSINDLKSAKSIQKKYSNRKLKIIKKTSSDSTSIFYIVRICLQNEDCPKILKKIRKKKRDWEDAYQTDFQRMCPNNIYKNDNVFICK